MVAKLTRHLKDKVGCASKVGIYTSEAYMTQEQRDSALREEIRAIGLPKNVRLAPVPPNLRFGYR